MSEVKQVIVFRHDLLKSLRKGKIAASICKKTSIKTNLEVK